MEAVTTEMEALAEAVVNDASGEMARSPIENPAIAPIPNDPLREPHPAEPGVDADGTASPLENPGDLGPSDDGFLR
jgi:hypothetical protein